MSITTDWTPKLGDPCPPLRFTQLGPHAYVDEPELARRREAWHAMNNAPPPDPPKRNAPEAATLEALKETHENTESSEEENAMPAASYPHGPATTEYALDWALAQDAEKPGPKLVLLILAWHCFNPGDTLAFPSVGEIAAKASMGRTAVLANLQRLQELGLIHDTGERKGRTRQVVVWRLGNSPESDPLNSSESEPLGVKGSGFSGQRVRIPSAKGSDSGHGIPPEPYGSRVQGGGAADADGGLAPAAAAASIGELPGGLDRELFALWVADRPAHEVDRLIAHGQVLAAGGHDLNALCRRSITEGWKRWPRVATTDRPRVSKAARKRAAAAFPKNTRKLDYS